MGIVCRHTYRERDYSLVGHNEPMKNPFDGWIFYYYSALPRQISLNNILLRFILTLPWAKTVGLKGDWFCFFFPFPSNPKG